MYNVDFAFYKKWPLPPRIEFVQENRMDMMCCLVPSGHHTGLSVPAYHRRDTLSNFYPLVALKGLHVQSVGTDAQSLVAPKCHSLLVNERSCMLCLNLHRALLRNTHMSIVLC